MKYLICILVLCGLSFKSLAQNSEDKKTSVLAFHLFYYDFKTAQQMKTSSLSDVLKNGKWSSFRDMQIGFGLNYLKGINQRIDLMATLDGSSVDYVFKDGTTNGSSKFLLDANAGFNLKLVKDSCHVVPYFFGGAGVSYYQQKAGLYFPAGLGVQFNLFNEAFIISNMQYRFAATSAVNNHFYYTIGVGTAIGKIKKATTTEQKVPVVKPVVIKPVEARTIRKDLRVKVIDDQTGIALPNATVTLIGAGGTYTAQTNAGGEAIFKDSFAGDYTIMGSLNGINTAAQTIQKSNFDVNEQSIVINLSHHDPRFTLVGTVEDKNTHTPMGGVVVSIIDKTLNKITTVESNTTDGVFAIQLSPNGDFVLSAKKASYISNIETVSTKGLNRSATLYVRLLLGIEETKLNQTISLKNIYYATGSSQINQLASSDLDKLILFLTDNPQVKLEIASHTDSRGSAASNILLSQRRAQEVVNYLQKHGINSNRLMAKGYGETRLINGCKDGVDCTEVQHEQNRRTEFKVVKE